MAEIKKICEQDGTPFIATRVTAKYCSDKCKKAASRGIEPSLDEFKPEAIVGMAEEPILGMQLEEIEGMRLQPIVAPTINKRAKISSDELLDRMNERLAAKGLPLLSNSNEQEQIEFVRTGIQEIDELTAPNDVLGWGGLPKGHITEVFGTKGAGKSSLMKQIIKFNEDLRVLYFDVENGLTNPPANVHMSKSTLLENIEAITCDAIDTDAYDLIIIDSVAMMSSQREKDADKAAMMEKAKAMSQFVRRVNSYLRDDAKKEQAPTAVVFINQLRDTGNSFGVKEFTPGGRSLEYGASLRMELRSAKADKIMKGAAPVGQKVRVKIEKSRFNGEDVGTTVVFRLMFEDL